MPVVRCPACDKAVKARDDLAGKTIRCPACEKPIRIPAEAADADGDDRLSPRRPAARRAEDEDARRPNRRQREDDEGGEEDRPARRRKGPEPKEAKSGGSGALLVFAGVGLVVLFLLCGGGAVGGYFLFLREPDKHVAGGEGEGEGKGKGGDGAGEKSSHLIPLPGKAEVREIHVPRGRRDLLIHVRPALAPDRKGNNPQIPQWTFHIDKLEASSGKVLGSLDVNHPDAQEVIDVSPDGSRVALKTNPWQLSVAVVSLSDGAVLLEGFAPTRPAPTDGPPIPVQGLHFRFLDERRFLCAFSDGAVEIRSKEGNDWRIVSLVPGKSGRKLSAMNSGNWCLSNDGKTLAYWNGGGFDLIDTTSGEVRGKTGEFALEPNETNFEVKQSSFSPDGTQILADASSRRGRKFERLGVYFPAGGRAAVRLPFAAVAVGWWGNHHLLRKAMLGSANVGIVFDLEQNKPLCDLAPRAPGRVALLPQQRDGKLRIFMEGPEKDGERQVRLFQADFPDNLLDEMRKPRDGGGLPVLQAADGLTIRP